MSSLRHLPHLYTLAWAVVLGLLLLLPAGAYDPAGQGWLDRLLDSVPLLDKAIHAALFAVQGVLTRRSLASRIGPGATVLATVLACAYGILLEVLQGPVPGRATGVGDMIANTVGALGGAIIAGSRDRSRPYGE